MLRLSYIYYMDIYFFCKEGVNLKLFKVCLDFSAVLADKLPADILDNVVTVVSCASSFQDFNPVAISQPNGVGVCFGPGPRGMLLFVAKIRGDLDFIDNLAVVILFKPGKMAGLGSLKA